MPTRDVLWCGLMIAVQCVWFVVRWTLGENAVDPRLVALLAAAIGGGFVLCRWRTPIDLPLVGSSVALGMVLPAFVVESFAALVQLRPAWDEPFLMDAARSVARGGFEGLRTTYFENPWLAPRHPPLGPVIYGVAMRIIGDGLIAMRLLAAAFAAVTVAATASIADRLYGPVVARRAAWLLLAFPLFVRIGAAVMTDMPVTCLVTLVLLIGLAKARDDGPPAGGWMGLLFGLALLTKYTAALAGPVLLATYALHGALWRRRSELFVTFAVAGGILLAWVLVLHSMGVLTTQVQWLSRYARVSSEGFFRPYSAGEVLLSKLPSAVGLYALPALAAGLPALVGRERAGGAFLASWILLVTVPLLATLPDNRYFLPAFPAFAILAALGVGRLFRASLRACWLALFLCAVTVVLYAIMPHARAVFLFGTLPVPVSRGMP